MDLTVERPLPPTRPGDDDGLCLALAPGLDPMECARRLAGLPDLVFLDSAQRHPTLGRHSFLAADPFGRFVVREGRATWNGDLLGASPIPALRSLLDRWRIPPRLGLPPFQGGAAGFFSYDFRHCLERLTPAPADLRFPQALLGFYDVVIGFDHASGEAWLHSTGCPEKEPGRRRRRARERAEAVLAHLDRPAPERGTFGLSGPWASNFSPEGFERAVQDVIDRILAGDIFQANIAQRFTAPLASGFDPLAFYEHLRRVNPATFGAYLAFPEATIASSSPERFVRVDGRRVETRPIKGTSPRSPDPAVDEALAQALLGSEKDRAENLMIVDLLRNDLSRVCRLHHVRTPILCGLETYASVHHLVSVVEGELRPGLGPVDVLAAAFPGGSITGAPKIRAQEIITEIEGVARGVYCGAIGYLGFDGSLDTNIAIRTVTLHDGRAVLQAGGGITALSDPKAEYQETLTKAGRILAAFEGGAP